MEIYWVTEGFLLVLIFTGMLLGILMMLAFYYAWKQYWFLEFKRDFVEYDDADRNMILTKLANMLSEAEDISDKTKTKLMKALYNDLLKIDVFIHRKRIV